MSIKAILFDLDGTLLPMNQDEFIGAYKSGLITAAAKRGYDPKRMGGAILAGLVAMIKNASDMTNEEVFFKVLVGEYGESVMNDVDMFDEFYQTDFQKIQEVCSLNPRTKEIIERIKSRGMRVVLATNPLFPAVATESRIRWAGLDKSDFELVTTFENSHRTKPNPDYYREVLDKIGLSPEECVMVGNDVGDDMVAERLGLRVFLLTDCLINPAGVDISVYPNGGMDELVAFIDSL